MLAGGDQVAGRRVFVRPVVFEAPIARRAPTDRVGAAEVEAAGQRQDLDPVPGRPPIGRGELVLVGIAVPQNTDPAVVAGRGRLERGGDDRVSGSGGTEAESSLP